MSYWDEIDQQVTDAEAEASDKPDPWADRADTDPALTEAQLAFLEGLADQPGVPRITGDPTGEATGDPTDHPTGAEPVPPG